MYTITCTFTSLSQDWYGYMCIMAIHRYTRRKKRCHRLTKQLVNDSVQCCHLLLLADCCRLLNHILATIALGSLSLSSPLLDAFSLAVRVSMSGLRTSHDYYYCCCWRRHKPLWRSCYRLWYCTLLPIRFVISCTIGIGHFPSLTNSADRPFAMAIESARWRRWPLFMSWLVVLTENRYSSWVYIW